MIALPSLLTCLAATAALLFAESRRWWSGRAAFKLIASTSFVLLAWQVGAANSRYGQLILTALVLGWIGDALLLSSRSRVFLLGLFSFLLSHVAFCIAFLQLPMRWPAFVLAVVAMGCVGVVVMRWLWPHLKPLYRAAVSCYMVAIVAMCSVGISAGVATGAWPLAVGAVAFAASDVFVARERFVAPGFANKACGLPLYYAAQVVLALSAGGTYFGA